jgi:hypothetical protein
MNVIKPKKVLFIKLGKGGEFVDECLRENTLKLGYAEVDHNLCINGNWDAVYDYFINIEKAKKNVASSHTNQIKQFYEEDENTLWITFHRQKLWWCFSKPEITLLPDNRKTRPVIGKWSDKNIKGETLISSNLSGNLLKTQSFRGTICKVPAEEYAISKINGLQKKESLELETAINEVKSRLTKLIQQLQPQDFEILVDLIFRQMGWQRVSDIGGPLNTIDFELLSPITGERAVVQLKSAANINDFKDYQNRFFPMMEDYNKFFFIVNNPDKSLIDFEDDDSGIILYYGEKISELVINSGLIDWVIKKS